jgi:anion-transporting  ArsA/GET3 family ATPase
MYIDDKVETESPEIIEEIIPGKNNDDNVKPLNQNNHDNHQPFIENYNEEQSAQSVLEVSEEYKESIEKNTEEASNRALQNIQAITDSQEQTSQATKALAGNYLELQNMVINSYQSVFMPYLENIQRQFWNNQDFFRSIPEMYSRLISNYTESTIAFGKMWNDIAFANTVPFRNAISRSNE